MEILKKVWKYMVTAIILLLGLFFYQRKKTKDAESKLEIAQNTQDNAVTNTKIDDLSTQLNKEKQAIEDEKKKKLSDKEMEEYLKKL